MYKYDIGIILRTANLQLNNMDQMIIFASNRRSEDVSLKLNILKDRRSSTWQEEDDTSTFYIHQSKKEQGHQ